MRKTLKVHYINHDHKNLWRGSPSIMCNKTFGCIPADTNNIAKVTCRVCLRMIGSRLAVAMGAAK